MNSDFNYKVLDKQNLNHYNLLPSLLDAGFFKGAANMLLSKHKSVIIHSNQIDNVFGLMFSMALKDNILALKYLLKLLPEKIIQKDFNYSYVKGALGIVAKETLLEKDIRFVLKEQNIDNSLAINLVHLVSPNIKKDFYNPAYRI